MDPSGKKDLKAQCLTLQARPSHKCNENNSHLSRVRRLCRYHRKGEKEEVCALCNTEKQARPSCLAALKRAFQNLCLQLCIEKELQFVESSCCRRSTLLVISGRESALEAHMPPPNCKDRREVQV